MHEPFLLIVPLATPPAVSLHMAPLTLDGVLLAALERRLGSPARRPAARCRSLASSTKETGSASAAARSP